MQDQRKEQTNGPRSADSDQTQLLSIDQTNRSAETIFFLQLELYTTKPRVNTSIAWLWPEPPDSLMNDPDDSDFEPIDVLVEDAVAEPELIHEFIDHLFTQDSSPRAPGVRM